MGWFDFLKSERQIKRDRALKVIDKRPLGYKFTTTDSFYRFTMGLKAWQIWRDGEGEEFLTETLKWWGECHEKYPKDFFPYFMLAMALCADGRPEEARRIFRDIDRLDPTGEFGDCARKNVQALDGFGIDPNVTVIAPDILVS